MRKALIPMLASLALCGAATTALVISTAHAQPSPHKPVMLAQADTSPPARRGFNRPAPADMADRMKQMCQDQVARETGRLAYLETRLDLTSSEQPLFQRWKDATLGVAHRHADQCNQQVSQRLAQRQAAQAPQGQSSQAPRNARSAANPTDRMAREEDRLKQRLADIEAVRPALDAFTNALSPTQKTELARANRGGTRNAMMRRSRFAGAFGQRGPRGPMGGPPGFGGPGAPPPPQER
jgi:hypothetical protein